MIFSQNSYRVLGVVSNSGVKEIKKNISKLKAFSKIGKDVAFDYDLSFLNLAKLDRKESSLLQSENSLNMDKNKITNSLFWFADLSSVDSVALANLIKGDTDKSIEILEKATKSNEVTSKNYSSFNNLSTLLLLNTLDDSKTDTFKKDNDSIKQIKKAIKLKNEFISSTFFNNYCESISKSTPLSSDAAQDFFTNTILDLFNKNFSTKELSDLFEGLDDKLKDTLNASLTEAPISNIKNHIETASELIKKNEKSGIKVGKQLIKDTLKDIKYLKEIFSQDDFQFQTLSDKLSNLILQCGIVCFNKTGDDQDYLTSYQYALSIAIDEKAKERAKDCIKHCKEQKEANLCPQCEANSIDQNSPITIEIYKETSRDYLGVRYRHGPLKLYYCKECIDLTKLSKSKKSRNGWIAAGISFLIIINISIFIVAVIGAILCYFIAAAMSDLTNAFDIYNHPVFKKHLREGWSTTQPTA